MKSKYKLIFFRWEPDCKNWILRSLGSNFLPQIGTVTAFLTEKYDAELQSINWQTWIVNIPVPGINSLQKHHAFCCLVLSACFGTDPSLLKKPNLKKNWNIKKFLRIDDLSAQNAKKAVKWMLLSLTNHKLYILCCDLRNCCTFKCNFKYTFLYIFKQ